MNRAGRWVSRTAAILCMTVLAACSVSTPRDGWTQAEQSVGAGPQGPRGGNTAVAPGESGPASGDTGAGVASGTSSGTGSGRPASGGTATTLAAASASAPTVGVTDKAITISVLAGFTGQYGPVIEQVYDNGFAVWAQDVNDHNGINGRQIVLKKVDHKDTVEGGVAACKTVQGNGSYLAVSIVGLAGSDVAAVDCLDKAGITTVAFNLSTFDPKWTHTYSPLDPYKASLPVASFTRNVLGEKGKIGVIYIQNDPVNRASRAGYLAGLEELGVTPVHEEQISSGQNSFVAELSRMRSSGATTVAIAANPNEATGVLRDAKAIGYSPKWTSLFFWTSDEFAAAGGQLMKGVRGLRHYATVESPSYKTYLAKANAQGKKGLINSTTMALYGMGLIIGQALQNAGATPTVTSLGQGIESIVNYDSGIYHLSFGKGVHVAEVAMWPIECCNDDNTWRGTGPPRTRF